MTRKAFRTVQHTNLSLPDGGNQRVSENDQKSFEVRTVQSCVVFPLSFCTWTGNSAERFPSCVNMSRKRFRMVSELREHVLEHGLEMVENGFQAARACLGNGSELFRAREKVLEMNAFSGA